MSAGGNHTVAGGLIRVRLCSLRHAGGVVPGWVGFSWNSGFASSGLLRLSTIDIWGGHHHGPPPCTEGCMAAPLVSTHWLLVASPSPQAVTTEVSLDIAWSTWGGSGRQNRGLRAGGTWSTRMARPDPAGHSETHPGGGPHLLPSWGDVSLLCWGPVKGGLSLGRRQVSLAP